jgi:hypothetical protein
LPKTVTRGSASSKSARVKGVGGRSKFSGQGRATSGVGVGKLDGLLVQVSSTLRPSGWLRYSRRPARARACAALP